MRERAIVELDKIHGKKFFKEISKGMRMVFENAVTIRSHAQILEKQNFYRGTRILNIMAEEEAAKYLILLDAVRCPREDNMLKNHLKHFNNHLAKGIYVECCLLWHDHFRKLREYIDKNRECYYLDGPNDVDYIIYNNILRKREDSLYVDYVDFTEDNEENKWISPSKYDYFNSGNSHSTQVIINLIEAFENVGFSDPEALEIIAQKWRNIKIENDLSVTKLQNYIIETLAELEVNKRVKTQSMNYYRLIIDRWFFPLYSLDLKVAKVTKERLHEIRERWSPY